MAWHAWQAPFRVLARPPAADVPTCPCLPSVALTPLPAPSPPRVQVTVLDKSRADWKDFKKTDDTIEEELEMHKRSGDQVCIGCPLPAASWPGRRKAARTAVAALRGRWGSASTEGAAGGRAAVGRAGRPPASTEPGRARCARQFTLLSRRAPQRGSEPALRPILPFLCCPAVPG